MIDLWERIALSVLSTGLFFAVGARAYGVMQQCGYKNARFFAWLKRRDNLWYNRLCLLFLMLVLSCSLTALGFSFLGAQIARIVSVLPLCAFSILFCVTEGREPLKVKRVATGRLVRLCSLHAVLSAAFCFALASAFCAVGRRVGGEWLQLFFCLPVCVTPLFIPWIFMAANVVSRLFEEPRNRRYVKKAAERLRAAQEKGCIVIGVTGSYGKTSVKNALQTVLSEKYRVFATPSSYNTPVGIAKSVLSQNFDDAQVFIAEMGAKKSGDIEELCRLFKPDYAIFTGVCRQHAETFGSEIDIFNEKKKIISFAKYATVCGGDLAEKYAANFTDEEKKKALFLPKDAVKNFGDAFDKTQFDLELPTSFFRGDGCAAEKTQTGAERTEIGRIELPLLGKGTAENVALAAATAALLGLDKQQILNGVQKVTGVPHRLQLIRANGIYVLDDGYNASEKSAAQALEVLKKFPGKKYVITPGIVETGIEDREVNLPLGEALAQFDGVFLHRGAIAVKEGYLRAGGMAERLGEYVDTQEATKSLGEKLGEGDAVLFLNDLPDAY